MKKLILLAALLLLVPHAFAAGWADLASGQHSFKTLGSDFYVDVPVRRIPNAKVTLSFVNRDLVKKLGLELPDDPVKAEEMLKDLFAWEVDPNGSSPKKWFATHYQDSNGKGAGEAQGDGRALWTGELQLQRPDGRILYVDGVQKGVGPTPYAWTNNPTHKDGKQKTEELVISGIRSMADLGNQLDSTGDILGFTIRDANGEVRSMTLRVGRQTRPAHIRYHDDKPTNERKMVDYIVTRDLGFPIGTTVTDDMFLQWEKNFALNNAEDTARVFALIGFYEHPTMGNKTTTGGSIDLNGRQYLDAYHTNMHHLYGRLFVRDQVQIQKDYLRFINGNLSRANYRSNINLNAVTNRLEKAFDERFVEVASTMFLRGLGLDDLEIGRLSSNARLELYDAMSALMRATGNQPRDLIMLNKGIIPAAFDTRKILRGTMSAFASSNPRDELAKLYTVDYKWNTTLPGDHPDLKANYERAVKRIVVELGSQIKSTWIANAEKRNKPTRFDTTSDGIWDLYAHPIRKMAEAGVSWVTISDQMEKAASHFVDADQPKREVTMLKAKVTEAPKVHLTAPTCKALFHAAG